MLPKHTGLFALTRVTPAGLFALTRVTPARLFALTRVTRTGIVCIFCFAEN